MSPNPVATFQFLTSLTSIVAFNILDNFALLKMFSSLGSCYIILFSIISQFFLSLQLILHWLLLCQILKYRWFSVVRPRSSSFITLNSHSWRFHVSLKVSIILYTIMTSKIINFQPRLLWNSGPYNTDISIWIAQKHLKINMSKMMSLVPLELKPTFHLPKPVIKARNLWVRVHFIVFSFSYPPHPILSDV